MGVEVYLGASIRIVTCSTCYSALLKISMSSMQVRSCCHWVYLAISQKLWMLQYPVHDSLDFSWRIGEAKRQYPEPVLAK